MTEEKVIKILKDNNIDVLTTLPCAKIKNLLNLVYSDSDFRAIALNKEEDGIGISAGVYLAGGKPAMIIQSSGLGNCFGALLSLTVTYKLPLPIITSWRGVYNEKISAQIPFNKDLPKALESWNIPYKIIESPDQISSINEVIKGAFKNNTPYVALVSPEFWGDNRREEVSFPKREKVSSLEYKGEIKEAQLTRYQAIESIISKLDKEIVVSNIGIPSKELYNIKDRALNFYMLGSFCQASAIGLGLALKTEKEVIVLDGDASLLGTNILSAVSVQKTKNLSIVCLDNGTCGSTGNQITDAYSNINMELLAKAMGIENTVKVHSLEELEQVFKLPVEKRQFVHVIVKPENAQVENIPLSPEEIKNRFRGVLCPKS